MSSLMKLFGVEDDFFWPPDLFYYKISRDGGTSEGFYPSYLEKDEGSNSYRATFDLPGVKRKDLKIEVLQGPANRREIIVEGKRGSSTSKKKVTLPKGVDEDSIKAKLEDGVLELTLPLKEEEKGSKKKLIKVE